MTCWLIVAVFATSLMPYLATYLTFWPDQNHYIHGALIMMDTGDYLTPMTAEGEIRLLKPPMTYWMSSAGMTLLGINPLGTRIAWLALAFGVLWLTHRLARRLSGDATTALFAVAILASNLYFIQCAMTSNPDLPLVFFMLLAFSGFAGLLVAETPRRSDAWAAYGGTALAILTKGLLPVAMLAYVAIAAMVSPALRQNTRRLLAPLPILVSVTVATSWFAYELAVHPDLFRAQFLGDQVTNKVAVTVFVVLRSIAISIGGLLPAIGWMAIVATAAVASRQTPSLRSLGPSGGLLAGWVVANVLIFAPNAHPYTRYVLPSTPMLAILIATWLASLDRAVVILHLRVLTGAGLVLLALLCTTLLGIFMPLVAPAVSVFLAVALVAGLAFAWRTWRVRRVESSTALFAAIPLLLLLFASPFIAAVGLPAPGEVLAGHMDQRGIDPDDVVIVGNSSLAAETNVYSGRNLRLDAAHRLEDVKPDKRYVVVSRHALAEQLRKDGGAIEELRGGWRNVDIDDLIEAILSGKLSAAKAAHGSPIFVAERSRAIEN